MRPPPDLSGKIQTVLGAIPPERLGVTLTHEHLLIDASRLIPQPKEAGQREKLLAPVTMELLGWLKYGAGWNLDNARLLDVGTAIAEVTLYRRAGGRSLVEATSRGIARDPTGLAAIARATGLNIIMGSSYYTEAGHPVGMGTRTEDSIQEEIVSDVLIGVEGTGVRAGIIGEVGCSYPLAPNERKVLRASGRAQMMTGAPLLIHPGRDDRSPREIIDVLRDVGADLGRTVIGHLDRTVFDRRVLGELADTGCMLEYDLFGWETSHYRYAPHIDMPNDAERLRWLAWLVAEGHAHQLLVAHDIDEKRRLVRYGGHGYAHILENIVPRMRARAFTEGTIDQILVDNPKRLLTFAAPPAEGASSLTSDGGAAATGRGRDTFRGS